MNNIIYAKVSIWCKMPEMLHLFISSAATNNMLSLLNHLSNMYSDYSKII